MVDFQDIQKMEDPETIQSFLFGGNATFTLKSLKSGNNYTYKMKTPKNKKYHYKRYLYVMTGTDNEYHYKYIGSVYKNKFFSNIPGFDIAKKGFEWFFCNILSKHVPETVEMYHSMKCAKCGRKLTTPESVKMGFGPVCIGKI